MEKILKEINYAAIFGVALKILYAGVLYSPVRTLLDAARGAQTLAEDGTDLMGRIYHRLLADAKPLGAFYTSIPAATLIAGLALSPKDWGDDSQWADVDFVRKFRIADPACGSGTLLAAACWQMRDNFSRADFRTRGVLMNGDNGETGELHKSFLEEVVWGYDILETAGHLTAMTLGLMAPDVDFRRAHIYRTIIGDATVGKGEKITAAGSLEMLGSDVPIFLREESKQVETADKPGKLPELDLCIMNPPFVRGTVDNLAYSFLGAEEQKNVRKRMNALARDHGYSNDKGLGPAFVALACRKGVKYPVIKEGGRIAAILPATMAAGMGHAWSNTRKKLENDFDLEMLIVSRDSSRPNFSENTALQECIVIARKRKKRAKPKTCALFAVLHKNPTSSEEALATVQAIKSAKKSARQFGDLQIGNGQMSLLRGKIGRFAKLPYYGRCAWRGTSFSDIRLAFVAENFAQTGSLSPYTRGNARLCTLGDVAVLGGNTLHLKVNHSDFLSLEIMDYKTNYPAYYPSYHREKTRIAHRDTGTIAEVPHCYVLPLPGKEEWIDAFYKKAGRVVLNESFRFNTVRRLAALVSEPVQAAHYWPITLRQDGA